MPSSVAAPCSSITPATSSHLRLRAVQVKPLARACPLAPQTALRTKPPPTSPTPFDLLWPPSSKPSLPSPSRSGSMTKRSKPFVVNATLKPSYSVLSSAWAHSRPWATSSPLRTPIDSAGVGKSVLPWASSPDGINPEIAIPKCAHLHLRCKCRCHKNGRRLPTTLARWNRPIHPGALRTGLRPATMGLEARRTGRQERKKESRGCRRSCSLIVHPARLDCVARKWAVLLHHLWKTGEIYDPFYLARKHDRAPEVVPAAA